VDSARRLRVELALLLGSLAVGLLGMVPELLFLSGVVATHLVLGVVLAHGGRPPRLVARRRLSNQRVVEDDAVEVSVEVENRGRPLQLVLVSDSPELANHVVEGEVSGGRGLARGERCQISYVCRPPRGVYPLADVHVEARDLLGYTAWQGAVPCPSPLNVVPRHERLSSIRLFPRRTLATPGPVPARKGGAGVQFFGVRDYVPGDDVRRINWKTLARLNRLVINEFEEERATDLALVLDGRRIAYEDVGGAELFQEAVRGCAALGDSLIREGHRTGLMIYGERLDWLPRACGRVQRERLLGKLAAARLGESDVFAELSRLPTKLFPSGSAVLLVSPFVLGDEEALGVLSARGYEVLALVPRQPGGGAKAVGSVSRELAARMVTLEREAVLQEVAAAGVSVLVWDVTKPLAPLIQKGWRERR